MKTSDMEDEKTGKIFGSVTRLQAERPKAYRERERERERE
jgi:hypothetical protein